MLDEARNRMLMEVGPKKPMGKLLRRYWMPISAVSEFDKKATKPIRLLGEDLVLYKDLSGTFGLIDRNCQHRRADLSYGFVEKCGLRCNYHGWLYDKDGSCIAQPYEDTVFPKSDKKNLVKIKAYPVETKAGLLWAYLGPNPAPLVPTWEPFTFNNGFVQIVFSVVPCNWFQCQENSLDPVHFEWMHANWTMRLKGIEGPYSPAHLKVDFEEFDYGFRYLRLREDTDENNPLWTIGRCCLWPNCLFTGDHFEWRVPIDDENTLSVGWFFNRVPQGREPYIQDSIPSWTSPLTDPETGRWIDTHVMNQDFIAWVGQGTFADRTKETLGKSDKGIAMLRKQFFDDMELIDNNKTDPKGIVRDPDINECIQLPIMNRKRFLEGLTPEEMADPNDIHGRSTKRFVFLAGQPQEVWETYCEAMRFKK
ncbi:MAG TPA: aromatic ring-hydroxylating dioxygenase subunit alpha [Rhodospirillales bacterium]|nr:aromatic ring-hydroxylating dioxygenase subunit alpha [Rhodospirillales bacterium]